MLVLIIMVPNRDNTGPDLNRIGKVEDIPDEIARTMVDFGTARRPTDEELTAYREAQPTDEGDATEVAEVARPGVFTPRFPVGAGLPASPQPAE